jgi:RNA polymerase sigma-70 factor (ECF subfamily)
VLDTDSTASVRLLRFQFLDRIEPLRPDLFRYCRSLTGSVWDAEDLVQDVLLKAFAKASEIHGEVRQPKAYLFRVATNLWLNQLRRRRPEALGEDALGAAGGVEESQPLGPEVREALEVLVGLLPPRARAAVLLKDVFGLSLSETARAMDTTTGAVKAALHRGRRRLEAARGSEEAERVQPSALARPEDAQLLDRFVGLFNARDLEGLAALFAVDAEAEVLGMVHELGRAAIKEGSLHHTLFDEEGDPRAELAHLGAEPVVVLWYGAQGERRVGDVLRFACEEGALRTLVYYYFCPELLHEVVGESLGLPLATNGYRYQPTGAGS